MPPDRPLRFLLLHSATGGGHVQAATAVAEALEARFGPQARTTLLDALAAYAPWPISRAPDWYGPALRVATPLYGLGFRLSDGRQRARFLSALFRPATLRAARRLLEDHPADVVAVFHPVPVHTLARALAGRRSPRLIAIGPDLVAMHAFWADPGVWRYLVATDAARDRLIRHGVPDERIDVVGLPVRRRFPAVRQLDPHALRRQLGLEVDRPVVVATAGGVGFAPLERVVRALVAAALPAQLVVVAGRNRALYRRLQPLAAAGKLRLEGFVDNMHEWMRAADVLVTKAGPATLAEALVVGVPLILWGAIPWQETPNVRLVTEAGAGIWAPGPRRTVEAVARLLSDPAERERMRRQALGVLPPDSADRIAEILGEAASVSRGEDDP